MELTKNKMRLSVLLMFLSLVCWVFFMYLNLYNNWVLMMELQLFNLASVEFSVSFIFDKISLSFGFIVTFISMCVFMFACDYMKDDLMYHRFIWILMSFVLSMLLLIFSSSIFTILLGWDGLGISSFALIIYYQSKESLGSGFLTLMINRVGDVLIMVSMMVLVVLGMTMVTPTSMNMSLIIILFSFAALTKSAQYPFSSWLPAAMAAPTPVSALVHSSTLVTAGVYLIIRVSFNLDMMSVVSSTLLFCGSITSLIGGMSAMYENDIKKIIALSTLSQLGVMMFSLGLNSPSLSLLHLYTHAMFKALLFLAAGVVLIYSYGAQDIRILGSMVKSYPIVLIFLNVSTLCLMGAPFLSAFYSKHAILELMLSSTINLFSFTLMMVATMLTSIYMIRMLKILSWSSNSMMSIMLTSKLNIMFYLPMIMLFLLSIMIGKYLNVFDLSFSVSFMIPSYYNISLTMIILFGVMISVFLYKKNGNYLLSSMFFMVPMSNQITFSYNFFSKSMSFLDYGWIEPYKMLSPYFFKSSNLLNMLFKWPSISLSFMTSIFMFIIIIICLFLIL
nr:NADH dehydrogenase subunit 5 [Haplotrema minimum]